MKKLKVLYILSSSSPFGGSSMSIFDTIVALKKCLNIEPCVIIPSPNGIYEVFIANGIKTYAIPVRHNCYPPTNNLQNLFLWPFRLVNHFIRNAISKFKLKKIYRTFKPDIIHTNVGVVNIGYELSKNNNIPHIYHLREFQDLDFGEKILPSKRRFIQSLNQDFNHNICITKGIQRYFNLSDDNSTIIYNGLIENEKNNKLDSDFSNRKEVFLFVGRLNESKGVYDVLNGFIDFKHKYGTNYQLWLVGAALPADQKRIAEICGSEKPEIQKDIVLLGPRTDINDLMKETKAVIIGSKFECFGRVTVEGMQNGLLVIGNDAYGTKEQFDNGLQITGKEIGIRFNNPKELCEILKKVVTMDETTYKEITDNAFNVVKKLYTIKNNSNMVRSVYDKVLKDNENYAQ